MFRKNIFIMLFVCLLGLAYGPAAQAADPWDGQNQWIVDAAEGSSNWDDPCNWSAAVVPTEHSWTIIDPRTISPIISGEAHASMLWIHRWTYDTANNNIALIVGPTATDVNFGRCLVIAGDSDPAVVGHAVEGALRVYGGTVRTPISEAAPELGLRLGGSVSLFGDGYGRVSIYGGEVNVPRLSLRYGEINLYGGTLQCTNGNNFDFYQGKSTYNGSKANFIDISGGTLKLEGDFSATSTRDPNLPGLIASRRIFSGHGTLGTPTFDGTYTTLTSTDNNMYQAWNPSPYNNQKEIHYRAADVNVGVTVTWSSGEPNVVAHQVYFGTSSALVNAATTASAEYKGEVNEANSEPRTWTFSFDFKINTAYYWRVDEISLIDDVNLGLTKGDIWTFTTHDGKAYNPKPINGATALNAPLALSWTAGDFAAATLGHKVYFTTAANGGNLSNPSLPRPTDAQYRGQQTGTSYPLASLAGYCTIVPGNTYYWAIDEVNGSTTWKGPMWKFTPTATYVIVDDFEDYNSTADITQNWVAPYTDCAPASNLYSRTEFVSDAAGRHMRIHYDNINGEFKYTEAKRVYSPATTLTGGGVLVPAPAAIGVEHIGTALNGIDPTYDRMYIAAMDTAGNVSVVLNPDSGASRVITWTNWLTSLTTLSTAGTPSAVNLQAVTGFSLGFGLRCEYGTPGTDGNVMFDNIRLYAQTCNLAYARENGMEADLDNDCDVDTNDLDLFANDWLVRDTDSNLTVSEPPTGPRLWYKFDETSGTNVTDYSGNGMNGTVNADRSPTWTTWDTTGGHSGGCIDMRNNSAGTSATGTWIDVPPDAYDANTGAITITWWQDWDFNYPPPVWGGVINMFDGTGAQYFEIQTPPMNGTTFRFVYPMGNQLFGYYPPMHTWDLGGRWNHFALVLDSVNDRVTGYYAGQVYANVENWTGTMWPAVPNIRIAARSLGDAPWGLWNAKLDDLRIYNYALDANQIAYVATDGTGNYYAPLPPGMVHSDLVPSTPNKVNFNDFAIMADEWRTQIFWP